MAAITTTKTAAVATEAVVAATEKTAAATVTAAERKSGNLKIDMKLDGSTTEEDEDRRTTRFSPLPTKVDKIRLLRRRDPNTAAVTIDRPAEGGVTGRSDEEGVELYRSGGARSTGPEHPAY